MITISKAVLTENMQHLTFVKDFVHDLTIVQDYVYADVTAKKSIERKFVEELDDSAEVKTVPSKLRRCYWTK